MCCRLIFITLLLLTLSNLNFMVDQKLSQKKTGIVLLYALLVSSVVLVIGLTLSNIILKQLIISSISREMNHAYYTANSGRECVNFLFRIQSTFLSDDAPTGITRLPYKCDDSNLDIGNIGASFTDLENKEITINYTRPGNNPDGEDVTSCSLINLVARDDDDAVGGSRDDEFKEATIQGYNTECDNDGPQVNNRTVERVLCINFTGDENSCTGEN